MLFLSLEVQHILNIGDTTILLSEREGKREKKEKEKEEPYLPSECQLILEQKKIGTKGKKRRKSAMKEEEGKKEERKKRKRKKERRTCGGGWESE